VSESTQGPATTAPAMDVLAEVMEYAIERVHEPSVRYGTMDEQVLRWLAAELPGLLEDRARYHFLRDWLRCEPGTEQAMPEGWLVLPPTEFDAAIDAARPSAPRSGD